MLPDGVFEPIDLHFAWFMMRLAGSTSGELALASALVSRLSREGHTCLDLKYPCGDLASVTGLNSDISFPDPEEWRKILRKEAVIGSGSEYRPLILDEAGRLYLHRSYEYEQILADCLLRLNSHRRPFDQEVFRDGMICMFSDDGDGNIPQKMAALMAVSLSLCVITGGLGTGETTLVCKILALLLEQEPHLKIALAAPTGKAARRIEEAVKRTLELMDCSIETKDKIPREAYTIHRLLGYPAGSPPPRRSSESPLTADVVVIDEASMVDLALMANLMRALKPDTRLILLGDKNQLASVQAGYVLGDICDTGGIHAYTSGFADLVEETIGCTISAGGKDPMQDSLVELTWTYRFSKSSRIHALSTAVNEGDAGRCLEIFGECNGTELKYRSLPGPEEMRDALRSLVLEGYGNYLRSIDVEEQFAFLNTFRILCPIREGPYGIKAMNRLAEDILSESGLLEPSVLHYPGRPVIVTQNDYTLRLFNGDMGVIVSEEDNLRACFKDKDASIRKISPMRLPMHETAFAMTVHKSQGSEFDRILFILPDRDSSVLTRELVYTAITRARSAITIWAHDEVLVHAVSRRTQRSSGLNSLLWDR